MRLHIGRMYAGKQTRKLYNTRVHHCAAPKKTLIAQHNHTHRDTDRQILALLRGPHGHSVRRPDPRTSAAAAAAAPAVCSRRRGGLARCAHAPQRHQSSCCCCCPFCSSAHTCRRQGCSRLLMAVMKVGAHTMRLQTFGQNCTSANTAPLAGHMAPEWSNVAGRPRYWDLCNAFKAPSTLGFKGLTS